MAEVTDWMSLAKPDPEWEQFVKDNMGGQQPDIGLFPDIPSLRQWITSSKQAMTAEMGGKFEGVAEHDEKVTVRDGHKIDVRIYSPEQKAEGGSPLVVIYHGGGWCIGDLENEELLCRLLTSKHNAICVNVDYRLGPEYKFPAAHNDCHDATKWAAENASKLGADPSKGFIIGGASAGGNITAAIALLLRDEPTSHPLTGLLLMIPSWCNGDQLPEKYKKDVQSPEQNKNAPILSQRAIDLFCDNYIDKKDRGDPLFSPLLWKGGLKGLPPSVSQICGQDPLRDEALLAERIMREEHGIKTKVDIYPGQPHGFHSIGATMKAAKKFVDDSVNGVGWLLQQS